MHNRSNVGYAFVNFLRNDDAVAWLHGRGVHGIAVGLHSDFILAFDGS